MQFKSVGFLFVLNNLCSLKCLFSIIFPTLILYFTWYFKVIGRPITLTNGPGLNQLCDVVLHSQKKCVCVCAPAPAGVHTKHSYPHNPALRVVPGVGHNYCVYGCLLIMCDRPYQLCSPALSCVLPPTSSPYTKAFLA